MSVIGSSGSHDSIVSWRDRLHNGLYQQASSATPTEASASRLKLRQ